jgi:TATA-binding protein-associated factor
MPRRSILHVHRALLEMIQLDQEIDSKALNGNRQAKGKGKGTEHAWQVRHAGLVGIKYEVAVRPDLFEDERYGVDVLRGVVDAAVSG